MDLSLLAWGDAGWGDEFARGAVMTMIIATCAFSLGIIIGSCFAAAKLSQYRALRILGDVYTTVVRGIPELLIIYLVFFGGGAFLAFIANALFGYDGYIDLPILAVGIVCIAATAGAYSTEVIRGAILAIPKGEIEAATAIGMGRWSKLRRILIPQAARFALPGLANVWQTSIKETSLISVVGLVEIMRTAGLAAGSTKEPFTFYLMAFVTFLALASLSNRFFVEGEKWANRGVRSS